MALFIKGTYQKKLLKIALIEILKAEYELIGLSYSAERYLFSSGHNCIFKTNIYMPIKDFCSKLNVSRVTLNSWKNLSNTIEVIKIEGIKYKRVELHSVYDFLND